MDPTCHTDGPLLVERAQMVRDAARLTCERASDARTSIGWTLTLTTFGDAGWTGARIGLLATGEDHVLVEASGSIDIASRSELRDLLAGVVDSGIPAVVVDLGGVSFLSSSGFECLHSAATLLTDRRGGLHVACPTDRPAARVIDLLAREPSWPVHPDVATAVAAVTGSTRPTCTTVRPSRSSSQLPVDHVRTQRRPPSRWLP